MIESYHNSPRRREFGVAQLVSLVLISLGSCLLAYILQALSSGAESLGAAISNGLPADILAPALWGVEIALFLAIAIIIARKDILSAIIVAVLGFLLRFGLLSLFALIVTSSTKTSFTAAFGQMQGELWVFRLLAILSSAAVLLALRPALAGVSSLPTETPTREEPKRFAFAPKAAPNIENVTPTRANKQAQHHVTLNPPEGFTPVVPRENVTGMVTIPASVIIESIPEVGQLFEKDAEVGVRLALLVPQLPAATAWLTWQQFDIRREESGHTQLETANLRDRWVRIPPRYYITQVPPEYFARQQRPTPWMSYPEVPQEYFNLDG